MKLSDFLVPVDTYNSSYIDASLAARVKKSGDTMSGNLSVDACIRSNTLAVGSFFTDATIGIKIRGSGDVYGAGKKAYIEPLAADESLFFGNFGYIDLTNAYSLQSCQISSPTISITNEGLKINFQNGFDGIYAGSGIRTQLHSYHGVEIYNSTGGHTIPQALLGSQLKSYFLQSLGVGEDNPAAWLDVSGNVSFDGSLNMNNQRILGLANPINSSDAVNKWYADNINSSLGNYVKKSGDTMSGGLVINAGGLKVTGDTSLYGVVHADSHVHVGGNLTVDGSLIYTNIQSINVSTGFIQLSTGIVGTPPSTLQSGIIVNRGTSDPYVFVYDEDGQNFRIGIATISTSTHYNDASTQAVATREDSPVSNGVPFWNASKFRFDTSSGITLSTLTTKTYVDGSLATRDSSISYSIGRSISNMSFSTGGLNVNYVDTTGFSINYSRFANVSTNNLYVRNIIESSVGIGINVSGNVGIGINPQAPLHVQSYADNFPQVRINASLGENVSFPDAGIRFRSSATATGIHADIFVKGVSINETGRMGFRVPYTDERMTILSDGKIGFGNNNDWTTRESSAGTVYNLFSVMDACTTSTFGFGLYEVPRVVFGAKNSVGNRINTAEILVETLTMTQGTESGKMHLRTKPTSAGMTTALFIDTNQNIGLGTITPSNKLTVVGDASISGVVYHSNGSVSAPSLTFTSDKDTGFYWTTSGQIHVANNGTNNFLFDVSSFHADGNIVGYSTSVPSDIRLKTNIVNINEKDPIKTIQNLRGVEYTDIRKGTKHSGLIAQEAENILPHIIAEFNLLNQDPSILYKTINYTEIIPYLIEAIKKQQEEIDELKSKIK